MVRAGTKVKGDREGEGQRVKGERGEGQKGQRVKGERDKSSKCHVCKYNSMQQEIFMKCNTHAICIIQYENEYHQAAFSGSLRLAITIQGHMYLIVSTITV